MKLVAVKNQQLSCYVTQLNQTPKVNYKHSLCCRPTLLQRPILILLPLAANNFCEAVKYFWMQWVHYFSYHLAYVPLIVFLDSSKQLGSLPRTSLMVIYCMDPSKSIVCLDSWPTWFKPAICNPTYNSTGCQNFLCFLARLSTLFVSAIYCLHLKLVMTN